MTRLSLKVVGSFMGNCLILTDNVAGKSIEIMVKQLQAVANTDRETGSLPHGGWDKDGENITVYHDDNRGQHEVTFTIAELEELL